MMKRVLGYFFLSLPFLTAFGLFPFFAAYFLNGWRGVLVLGIAELISAGIVLFIFGCIAAGSYLLGRDFFDDFYF